MAVSPIKARMDQIQWKSEADAEYMGLNFYFQGKYGDPPPPDKVFVFKSREFFEIYAHVLGEARTRNVLELGIWQGGSAVVLAALLDVKKIVCIDIIDEAPTLENVRENHPIGKKIQPCYGTSQDDEIKLNDILDREFDGPPDIILDDASHQYSLSRDSFEILYPRLRAGGWYIVEDWAWAHALLPIWEDQPSLAGLMFELQLVMACSPHLIEHVVAYKQMMFIKKPENAPVSRDRLNLRELYTLHHRSAPLVK